MHYHPRTDLALEIAKTIAPNEENGFTHRTHKTRGIEVFSLSITREEGVRRFRRPKGQYVTLSFSEESIDALVEVLSEELAAMLSPYGKIERLLAVGLGNSSITADAIGPETVEMLTVTGHLEAQDGHPKLFAIAPSIIGKTGLESFTLIEAAKNASRATHVIVIDALAAESTARLYRTVQLANSGITPGSGVGNHRKAISEETLGVPVIAVGVPSVVSSSTLVFRTLEAAGLSALTDEVKDTLQKHEPFFVTPPDADRLTTMIAAVLANAIHTALLPKGEDREARNPT